jgi:hypothetical protein
MPTALPSPFDMNREKRLVPTIDQAIHESVISSKDDATLSEIENANHINLRERRFFFNNNALMSVSTSFVFVPVTLTQTVNLVVPAPGAVQCDNTAGKLCAGCLPAGYIVCI